MSVYKVMSTRVRPLHRPGRTDCWSWQFSVVPKLAQRHGSRGVGRCECGRTPTNVLKQCQSPSGYPRKERKLAPCRSDKKKANNILVGQGP